MKNAQKYLSGDVDDTVNKSTCFDCVFMNTQALDCMAVVTNFISNRGVTPDAKFIGTLGADSILHFKKVMRHMDDTKTITYSVELPKIPSNNKPNTSEFNNCFTTTEEELYHKTSAYGISPLGYGTRISTAPVDYGHYNQNKTLI